MAGWSGLGCVIKVFEVNLVWFDLVWYSIAVVMIHFRFILVARNVTKIRLIFLY